MGISVVINTFNEEKNIQRALESVKWANEVIVCDMYSDDKTVEIAKKFGAKVFLHKKVGFVEPARNFAISKATQDWVFILDADEEASNLLGDKVNELIKKNIESNFVEIPRKNIIFNKWMQASMWWPDYQIRLFKKGAVVWSDQIHSKPKLLGLGLKLAEKEEEVIIHHNYQTISQFLDRMNRYTQIEAQQLSDRGYKFDWKDLFTKPLNEFLARFFANQGYKDGLHGLALSLLQALSFLVVYLKVWEKSGFKEQQLNLSEIKKETDVQSKAIDYWFKNESKGFFKRFTKLLRK